MRSDFHERRTARLQRLRDLVAKREGESTAAYEQFDRNLQAIPLGQPILVGHHSERGHRAHLARIDQLLRRSHEAHQAALHHSRSIAAMESNRAISSDDPEAIAKLRSKVAQLEDLQRRMVEVNKAVRKKDLRALEGMGCSAAQINQLLTPDFMGRVGFADYQLSTNSGNLRRLRQRLAHLEASAGAEDREITLGEIRIINSVSDNRTQVFFPDKPSESARTALKHLGFHWSPTVGAWQRNLSPYAWDAACDFVSKLNAQPEVVSQAA